MNTQPTLPDHDTAFNNIFFGVRAPVFFRKCAAAGIEPRTEQEAEWMLSMAAELRGLEQQVKQASASPIAAMYDDFNRQLTASGRRPIADQSAFKQAADSLAGDAVIYNSILSLKAHQAADIEQQFARNTAV